MGVKGKVAAEWLANFAGIMDRQGPQGQRNRPNLLLFIYFPFFVGILGGLIAVRLLAPGH